jgi:hypothetical protein
MPFPCLPCIKAVIARGLLVGYCRLFDLPYYAQFSRLHTITSRLWGGVELVCFPQSRGGLPSDEDRRDVLRPHIAGRSIQPSE